MDKRSQSEGDGKPIKDPWKGWMLRQIDHQIEPLIKYRRDDRGQLLIGTIAEKLTKEILLEAGRTTTPAYRFVAEPVFNVRMDAVEWRRQYGRPTAKNIEKYVEIYNRSLESDGVNSHLGHRWAIQGGHIIDQNTNQVVIEWIDRRIEHFYKNKPKFEVIGSGGGLTNQDVYTIARSLTAGVGINVVGYDPKTLWWVLTHIVNDVDGTGLFRSIDIDGFTDGEALRGTINCYMHPGDGPDEIKEALIRVKASVKRLPSGFRVKIKQDTSKAFGVPTIRVIVIDNPEEDVINSLSMTYTTWGQILGDIGLPNDQDAIMSGDIKIRDFLRAAQGARPSGNAGRFLKSVVDMCSKAFQRGYKEISWG